MPPSAWIALAGLGVTLVLSAIGFVVWLVRMEGRVGAKAEAAAIVKLEGQVSALEKEAQRNGDLRDLVIELRSDVRNFQESVKEVITALSRPARRRTGE